jgi:cobalamin biosynthesis protein CbiG
MALSLHNMSALKFLANARVLQKLARFWQHPTISIPAQQNQFHISQLMKSSTI